jgi:hypothetical protein
MQAGSGREEKRAYAGDQSGSRKQSRRGSFGDPQPSRQPLAHGYSGERQGEGQQGIAEEVTETGSPAVADEPNRAQNVKAKNHAEAEERSKPRNSGLPPVAGRLGIRRRRRQTSDHPLVVISDSVAFTGPQLHGAVGLSTH